MRARVLRLDVITAGPRAAPPPRARLPRAHRTSFMMRLCLSLLLMVHTLNRSLARGRKGRQSAGLRQPCAPPACAPGRSHAVCALPSARRVPRIASGERGPPCQAHTEFWLCHRLVVFKGNTGSPEEAINSGLVVRIRCRDSGPQSGLPSPCVCAEGGGQGAAPTLARVAHALSHRDAELNLAAALLGRVGGRNRVSS